MSHPAFEHIRTESIPTLKIDVEEYRHRETGARHYHLASEDKNKAFLVAFLTVPQDSRGVAHILEHTSLCGSRQFPVRDPFFMMTRRSLNTFMNAFTSSDWTAYPFASQNDKDFDNLLQVYLDAVFFPKLDPLDFAQEGHRLEFAEMDNPNSELLYKGVVFNEMKGAMSSPVRAAWQTLQSALFPTITYHHNSGGEPEVIPDLTYEQLKGFHARHYHPSNAIFMTYGDVSASELQTRFEEKALHEFKGEDIDLAVPAEQRFTVPLNVQQTYALDGEDDTSAKTYVVNGWLLGKNTDLMGVMEAHLMSEVLLANSASPLRQALETSDLGVSPSELCGLDDSSHELIFVAGVDGSEPKHAESVEQMILHVLTEVAEQGVPKSQVESVLHQLELQQREVGGGSFPYGLSLMVNALSPAIHGADPVAVLNIDKVLAELRERIQNPDYIKGLVRSLLLDNPHRVRLVMSPDPDMSRQKAQAEADKLAAIKAALDEQQSQAIIDQAQALAERQMQEDDAEILPKVTLADVPDELHIAEGEQRTVAGNPATFYAQGTNGLVYTQLIVDLPTLSAEQLQLLPLFCDCLTEVGVGDKDYLDIQSEQAAITGGIGARVSIRPSIDDMDSVKAIFILSGKALERNLQGLSELLQRTFEQARFDELPRFRELIAQSRVYRESSVTDRGHSLAMTAAAASLAPVAQLAHRWGGLEGIAHLKTLDDSLDDAETLAGFAGTLAEIAKLIRQSPRQFLVVSEAEHHSRIEQTLAELWSPSPAVSEASTGLQLPAADTSKGESWGTSTQVNFCAKAYPTVNASHADAPALAVLGGFLRNGHLHRAVREQGGAYGGGAAWDGDSGSFRFYSYRDPRLDETLEDFDASIPWLLDTDHEPRMLEEAILGVISGIDRPDSPAGEAVSAFFANLNGRTPEHRRRFRNGILNVTMEDLKRVTRSYLNPANAITAVVTAPKAAGEAAERLGLDLKTL